MNFSEAIFYENYLTLDFHTNTVISRNVCPLVKMVSEIVIRPIYEQNLSKPTCFTVAVAMLGHLSWLFFVLLLFYDSSFRLNFHLAWETLRLKFQNTRF